MLPTLVALLLGQVNVQELKVDTKAIEGGEFSYTTGFYGESLRLKSDGSFDRGFWQDIGPSRTRTRGKWRVEGDIVELTFAAKGGTRRLVPIRWDSFYYLVHESQISQFARWGTKTIEGFHPSRRGTRFLAMAIQPAGKGRFVPRRFMSLFGN